MGEHHVGLDIGSFAVRAAEVSVDAGVPTLHRFAQITLPNGAVVEGEITDRAAVAAAIRDLWEKGGFKPRKIVVGLSSHDVKVRQADVPDLSPEEIRSALRYETPDVLPFADDSSVVDFLVQERFSRDGADMCRVLMVAAPRRCIDDVVGAAADAGLTVEGVDFTPFALARALSAGGDGAGEVIVSVGGGLTSVVVHADGVPRLVRTTPGGGASITEALAEGLSVRYEEAEAMKRTGRSPSGDGRVAALVEDRLEGLVGEIAGSVDYFLAQTLDNEVSRVVVTGAGSLVPGLRDRIAGTVHLPVVPADALRNVALGRVRLTPEQLVAASTTLAEPIGLALAPLTDPAGRLTALLPDGYVERVRTRVEAKVVAGALCALALLLGGLTIKRALDLHAARSGITHEERLQRALAARQAQLAPLAQEQASLTRKAAVATAALGSDVDPAWVVREIAAAMPPDVWINSVQLGLAPGAHGGGQTLTLSLSGSDPGAPAAWITAMRTLTGVVTNVWVPSVSNTTRGSHQVIAFTGKAQLGPGAVSSRSSGFKVPR